MLACVLSVVFVFGQGSDEWTVPPVNLADIDGFRLRVEDVAALLVLARVHPAAVEVSVEGNNSPAVVFLWGQECRWRQKAWECLAAAMDDTYRVEYRLDCLARLWDLIGEEAYCRRLMPMPIPSYKGRP